MSYICPKCKKNIEAIYQCPQCEEIFNTNEPIDSKIQKIWDRFADHTNRINQMKEAENKNREITLSLDKRLKAIERTRELPMTERQKKALNLFETSHTTREIAKRLGVSTSAASQLLKRLRLKGLI